MLRFFLLFAPEDSSAQFVTPAAVDVFVQGNGLFQIVGLLCEAVVVAIIQCDPDVVIVVASMLTVFDWVRLIACRKAFSVPVLFQSRQDTLFQYRLLLLVSGSLVHGYATGHHP